MHEVLMPHAPTRLVLRPLAFKWWEGPRVHEADEAAGGGYPW